MVNLKLNDVKQAAKLIKYEQEQNNQGSNNSANDSSLQDDEIHTFGEEYDN